MRCSLLWDLCCCWDAELGGFSFKERGGDKNVRGVLMYFVDVSKAPGDILVLLGIVCT